ncbi:MAG: ABC transporter substrate-binding protein [Carboxydocellales bacterium]
MKGSVLMKRFSRLQLIVSLMMVIMLLFSSASGVIAAQKLQPEITLATTTSTQDSGLLDGLIPAFTKLYGIKVKVVAVGTGQAIQLGKDGNADVLLVHARKSEDEFMAQGYGLRAWDVMYNQFYIVGPNNDPAGIKGMTDATLAFKKIADSGSKFISRGDDSGTHKKEKTIWEKAALKPEGSWYISVGQGMGETLKMAEEMGAYTLVDEATFLTNKAKSALLVKGDKTLFNPYGVIEVKSTQKHSSVNEFIWFLISPRGQKMIGDFGKDKFGKSVFMANQKKR